MFTKRNAQLDARDQTYVDLAEQSCNFPDDGSLLNMCSIKEGLEVLNVQQGEREDLGAVLLCLAVSCSVLQCVAVCCSVLQCVAIKVSVRTSVLCCRVLQCGAVCCSVL